MYEKELKFAKSLAINAGKVMLKYFRSDSVGMEWKEDNTPLTIADTTINKLVIEKIGQSFPGHDIIGEEESKRTDSQFSWVCDPIDGTTPYSHGVPNATFNLALVYEGNTVMSVVYDPFCDRMYHAVKGEGAFLNNRKLNINHTTDNGKRVPINLEVWAGFSSGMSVFTDTSVNARVTEALADNAYVPLTFCSVAYSVVNAAEGGMKGIIFGGRNPWDAAACTLVASESGLIVTDIFGNDLSRMDQKTRGFLIGTKPVHADLLKRFSPILVDAKQVE